MKNYPTDSLSPGRTAFESDIYQEKGNNCQHPEESSTINNLVPVNAHNLTSFTKERAKYNAENPDNAALNAESGSAGATNAAVNQTTAMLEKNSDNSLSWDEESNINLQDSTGSAELSSISAAKSWCC